MIKSQRDTSQLPKTEPTLYVTATLLNSWQRIWDAKNWVRESEDDTVAVEDKIEEAMEKAKAEFIDCLNRVPIPDNEAMKKGREYEQAVYDGKDDVFSPIVENGEFQAAYTKQVNINGLNIMLYGILDCLKAGRIYDIKRVGHYQSRKYLTSHQHPMYFALVPKARDFCYLVMDDKGDHHIERYEPCNCENVEDVIAEFITWLQSNDLFKTYTEKWRWDARKRR